MTWSVQPEPTDESERRLLIRALEQALAEDGQGAGYATAWWRSGLDDLGGGAAPEQSGGEPRVVEA